MNFCESCCVKIYIYENAFDFCSINLIKNIQKVNGIIYSGTLCIYYKPQNITLLGMNYNFTHSDDHTVII